MAIKIQPEDLLDVADVLQYWHGGQWTATYAVMSSVYAGNEVDSDLAMRAVSELSQDRRHARGKDKRDLDRAISQLEYAAQMAALGHRAMDNPIPQKTKDALVATGVLVGGLGIFALMLANLPKKKQETSPATPTPTGLTPINFTEPTFYVYQRYVESIDTQGMRCTLPQFVAALPKSAADALARSLTTRAAVGSSGIVAVSTDKAVGSECNWRRVCLADGSCVGVIGLRA